jgi:hypothetical protein
MFKIIENCSPYYITFTYDGLTEYIQTLQNIASLNEFTASNNYCVNAIKEILPTYLTEDSYITNPEHLKLIIDNNPCFSLLNLEKSAAFLTTLPGTKSVVHYDIAGTTQKPVRVRINYPVFIYDNKCITNWYGNEKIVAYNKLPEVAHISYSNPPLLKSTHLSQDYAMLINTSIYHNWDNTLSNNKRTILGTRPDIDHINVTFEDFRKILFGI